MARKNTTRKQKPTAPKQVFAKSAVDASFILQQAVEQLNGDHYCEVLTELEFSHELFKLLKQFEQLEGNLKPLSHLFASRVGDDEIDDETSDKTFAFRSLLTAVYIAGGQYESARRLGGYEHRQFK